MVELLNYVMGVEVKFICQNANLLENNEFSCKLFALRKIFLEPIFRFSHQKLFLKHLEFNKPITGEEIEDSLFLVKDERVRNVVRILVLAFNFFFFDDFGKYFFKSSALIVFSKFRIFEDVLEADGVADSS